MMSAANDLCTVSFRSQTTVEFGAQQWDRFVRGCTSHNAAQGITGRLLYDGTQFLHSLEGPRPAVRTLMQRIESDPRHRQIIPFGVAPIAARAFEGWSAHFGTINTDLAARLMNFGYLNLRDPEILSDLSRAIRAA